MAYIPNDARWYLADVVLEINVAGDVRNVVHVNMHLIQADSPERAYEKAISLGRASEQVFTNTDGREVRVAFRGLRDLNVIHDRLEDGAELVFEESTGVTEAQLSAWLRPKERLSIFSERCSKRDAANYMPDSVMKSLEDAGFGRDEIEREG